MACACWAGFLPELFPARRAIKSEGKPASTEEDPMLALPPEIVERIIEFAPIIVQCVKYELIHPGPRWFEGSFRTLYRVDFPQGVWVGGCADVEAEFIDCTTDRTKRSPYPTLRYAWETKITAIDADGITIDRGSETQPYKISRKILHGRILDLHDT